jgi:[ribosomal protein S5]-alanine N-acetyltransferase
VPTPRRPVRLEGPTVVLRALRPGELPILQHAYAATDLLTRPGPSLSTERLRKRIERSGRFYRGVLNLGMEVDGRLIGDIQARTRPAQTLPPGVFELGIEIFEPADRRRGRGSQAVSLLTGWLFDEAGARRVQVSTAASNGGMRGVLERLGFPLEGILRGFAWPGDEREDLAMYGVTRDDWPPSPGQAAGLTP